MNTSFNVTDMYMSILSSLTNDEKLDLIEKLLVSMRKKKEESPKGTELFARFHEDWGGNGSPDEIAEELRKARHFTRTIEDW